MKLWPTLHSQKLDLQTTPLSMAHGGARPLNLIGMLYRKCNPAAACDVSQRQCYKVQAISATVVFSDRQRHDKSMQGQSRAEEAVNAGRNHIYTARDSREAVPRFSSAMVGRLSNAFSQHRAIVLSNSFEIMRYFTRSGTFPLRRSAEP